VSKLKENLKSYRVLASNFTSLSILQISNYLFPLILLPYLVRVLGAEKYGLISFAIAFNAYFTTLCDYGFNLSGTKFISVNRDSIEKLSTAFSAIVLIKFLLFILSLIILLTIVFTFDRFTNEWQVYILGSGFILGNVFFPLWFFQGIEKMKYISFIQILIRFFFTVSVFLFVVSENDYLLYVLLLSLSQIIIGLAGLSAAIVKFKIRFRIPKLEGVKFHLKDGWNIFLSMISINIYTTSNTFILGLFAPDAVVGYFAAADKLRLALQGIISVISQTVYPHGNNLLRDSFEKFSGFIKKLLSVQSIIGFFISIILFFFSELLVQLILGNSFYDSILILKILSPLPFLIALSNVFGIQIMLSLGFDKQFNKILFAAAVIHIIILFMLIPNFFAIGTSISMGITEGFVTLTMFIFVLKKTIVFKNKNV
jgi:PST family polysaccharide transporter